MRRLARWLADQGWKVVVTREPGGTAIAEKIRRVLLDKNNRRLSPMAELLLLEASRAQHVHEVIAPALARGAVVLCDRFADSSTAYQGYGRGLELRIIEELNRIATAGVWPDLTLVLDLPPEVGFKRVRRRRRALDRMERQERIFHHRVRKGYLEMAKKEPHRVKVLNARELPDVVQAAVRQLVNQRLGSRDSLRGPAKKTGRIRRTRLN